MTLNIVGVSCGYHDAACCLLQDGAITVAVQEERFTRIKNDPSIPRHAFRHCLESAGLTIADIDAVAYYEDPRKKLGRQAWMCMAPGIDEKRRDALRRRLAAKSPREEIRSVLGFECPVEVVDHHMAHAASSFYFSGFADAAVLTADGVGEWTTTAYGKGDGTGLHLFEEVQFPHSLGLLYSAMTAYLGFEVNEGEYKVMGLAPYGKPSCVDRLRRLIADGPDGQFRLAMEYFDFMQTDRMYSDALVELMGAPARVPESAILQVHCDIARSLQVVLEEILLSKVAYLHGKVPSENLCMAGGVALNCVSNTRILKDGPFKRLFIQPAAGDSGGAVGAAAVAQVRLSGRPLPTKAVSDVYLGPSYSNDEVRALLDASGATYLDYSGRRAQLLRATAERIARKQIVGWFQGRMEMGPRALGARSILADPRVPDMRDRINECVKHREGFRPFAPVVLASRADEYFALDHASPFMLEVVDVKFGDALPAVTHVDGSARVQTVDEQQNPRLAALLEEFDRQTGCPILLNTSFNVRGEPIVCSPEDAFLCFVRSNLDALVIEDFILDRSSMPAYWPLTSMSMGMRRGGIAHDVYTMV